jgi:predicted metal-dependent hydrolase
MNNKSAKVAALIEQCQGRGMDAHYLGFFECFNRGLYFEAHEVLEELWLPSRRGPNDNFYRGLIQLAGAFVHLQKRRLRPAGALLERARSSLQSYPPVYERLNLDGVRALIEDWLKRLQATDFGVLPLTANNGPELSLSQDEKEAEV